MVRTAILVSGGGTNLEHILKNKEKGNLKECNIVLVISSSSKAFALERARRHGVPALVIRDEEELARTLEREGIELIVLAGYLKILSEDFIKKYPKRIINIHPSLIPSFCGKGFYGLKVHEEALKRGVKVTGATVHYVDEIVDGGEIIIQKACNVHKDDTPETLQKRVMRLCEWKILSQAIDLVTRRIEEERK